MSDAAWDAYADAASTQVAAALQQLVAESGARVQLTTRSDPNATCDFCVKPEKEGAVPFRVILGVVDGRIHIANAVYRFEWLDISTAREIVAQAFAAVIAGRYIEWGPTWHSRGRLELADGRRIEFGTCALMARPWRGSPRTFLPYSEPRNVT